MGNQTDLDNIWEKLNRLIKFMHIEYINLGTNVIDKMLEKINGFMYQ